MADQNYTLGRGELFFAPFAPGTQTPQGERYIGNTPEFSMTIEEEKLDHYSSDRGIREKDDSISLQVNRSASFTTDSIQPKNVAMFFFSDGAEEVAVVGAAVVAEAIGAVEQDLFYQLGVTPSNPIGASALDENSAGVNVLVKEAGVGGATFVEGTDYIIDMDKARLQIVLGGGIDNGTELTVGYKTKTSTRSLIQSGSAPVEGQLRYVAHNPKGDDIDYLLPWVTLSPNGDYNLKSDEWQTIPFSVEILKKTNMAAIYANGAPKFA